MKLIVHLCPRRRDAQAAFAASALAAHGAGDSADLALEVSHPALRTLMQQGDSLGGLGVSSEWVLSDAEAAAVSHFSVVCRQTVPESDAAYKRNHDRWAATPETQAGAGSAIRLVHPFHLSHVKLKPKTVAGIGEWTESYLAGAEVWQAIRDAELTGVVPAPVLQVRTGAPFAEVHQLVTEAILPPLMPEDSAGATPGNGGLLSYRAAQLADHPDFMLTAEPWAHDRFGWPLWVVSARVRSMFRERGLRGWSFRPVLTVDSALHADCVALWESLQVLLHVSQHCQLESRTW